MENEKLLMLAQKIKIRKYFKLYDDIVNFDIDHRPAEEFRINVFHIKSAHIGHFVCVIEKNDWYFFDSFGKSPRAYGAKWKCKYNFLKLQDEHSCMCGAYTLFIAYHSMKLHPDQVVRKFFHGKNERQSERMVFKWLNDIIPCDYLKLMKCRI